MTPEPFAYGIQAPIGSVTPLFHKLKDAEAFIAKLTDSRAEAKIIPLYRASPTVEIVMETARRVCAANDELYAENMRLRLTPVECAAIEASREFWTVEAECGLGDSEDALYANTLRGLLARLGDDK